jgi:hypothetical protein
VEERRADDERNVEAKRGGGDAWTYLRRDIRRRPSMESCIDLESCSEMLGSGVGGKSWGLSGGTEYLNLAREDAWTG